MTISLPTSVLFSIQSTSVLSGINLHALVNGGNCVTSVLCMPDALHHVNIWIQVGGECKDLCQTNVFFSNHQGFEVFPTARRWVESYTST